MFTGIWRWFFTSDMTSARAAALVRHLVIAGGFFAVGKGWISHDMLLQIAQLVATAVPFYLGQKDVSSVADNHVTVAAVKQALQAQRQVDQASADRVAAAIAEAARSAPHTKAALLAELSKGE
jgi:hypothetical protein